MIPDWFFLHKWNNREPSERRYKCDGCGLLLGLRQGERWVRCCGDGWHELRRAEHDRKYRLARGQRAEAAEGRR